MRGLEKRLRDLEHKFYREVVILEMPDGTSEEILVSCGGGLLDLVLQAASEPEVGVGFSPEVDAIRRSIRGTEKGGHMIELARAVASVADGYGRVRCDWVNLMDFIAGSIAARE